MANDDSNLQPLVGAPYGTAVCGPACTVVWEGRSREASPYPDDYLFLAFNTSTAFSHTDTAVLSRWAKLGTMLQSLISLTIIALLAARAVNIL